MREALVGLARDGLVTSRPRSGYLVVPITLGDARELCGLRRALTPEAAFLAAERGLTREWIAGQIAGARCRILTAEEGGVHAMWLDPVGRQVFIREVDSFLDQVFA